MKDGKIIVDLLVKRCSLNSVIIEEIFNQNDFNASPSPLLESMLSSSLNSEDDSRAKKLIAAAMHIAAAKGHQFWAEAKPMTIAPIVDEAYSRLKTGFLIQKRTRIEDAVDYLIDRSAARLIVLTDRVIKKGVDFWADKLVDAITVYCPPIAVVAPFVKIIANRLTPVCQKLVRSGIQRIAEHARKAFHSVMDRIPVLISSVKKLVIG